MNRTAHVPKNFVPCSAGGGLLLAGLLGFALWVGARKRRAGEEVWGMSWLHGKAAPAQGPLVGIGLGASPDSSSSSTAQPNKHSEEKGTSRGGFKDSAFNSKDAEAISRDGGLGPRTVSGPRSTTGPGACDLEAGKSEGTAFEDVDSVLRVVGANQGDSGVSSTLAAGMPPVGERAGSSTVCVSASASARHSRPGSGCYQQLSPSHTMGSMGDQGGGGSSVGLASHPVSGTVQHGEGLHSALSMEVISNLTLAVSM